MSDPYSPTKNATAGDPWDTAFLSERDVSAQVPVNYVSHPAISITPACFPNGVYEDDDAQLCLSNLIASQLRRFVIDIYWDPVSRIWGLCPVRLPNPANVPASTSSLPKSSMRPVTSGKIESAQELRERQTAIANSSSLVTTSAITSAPTTTTASVRPVSSLTSDSGTLLYQLGRYQCSPSLDIDTVLAVFLGYFEQSANTIDARLQYLIFNLKTARVYTDPDRQPPALTSQQLPGSNEHFGMHFESLESHMYTPSQLAEDRSNLNATWYRQTDAARLPLSSYLNITLLPNGAFASPTGWPNEPYIQFSQSRRALVGYGSIDTGMQNYSTGLDSASIFSPGTLSIDRSAILNQNGSVGTGCFYDASKSELSEIDNSWAFSSILTTNLVDLGYAADNLSTCGISPNLNTTLLNVAADDNPGPYQDFGNQALFSWSVDEPKNDIDYDSGAGEYRCAIAVSDSNNRGHWRVANCLQEYYVACRQGRQPYRWQISANRTSYANGPDACTGNATFDVPRTGLENNYLHQQILQEARQRDQTSMIDGVWLNFNSLDLESCWVTTGPNGTCPYQPDKDAIRQRQILVPAIAAFIVLILTVLTILVKCSSNRRNSKIRKRGEGGWDYEGVPS